MKKRDQCGEDIALSLFLSFSSSLFLSLSIYLSLCALLSLLMWNAQTIKIVVWYLVLFLHAYRRPLFSIATLLFYFKKLYVYMTSFNFQEDGMAKMKIITEIVIIIEVRFLVKNKAKSKFQNRHQRAWLL